LVKAFNTGAYSVEKNLKHTQLTKQILLTNNRLKARNNRLFWFDSKSTNQNSFQTFQKHLRVKQLVVSTKQQVVFNLV